MASLDQAIARWQRMKRTQNPYGERQIQSNQYGYGRNTPSMAPFRRPDYIEEKYKDAPYSSYYKGDITGMESQFSGQAPHLASPMVREMILANATSEANIAKLIQAFGIATVERVLREDVRSGQFHSESDMRGFSDDDANISALDELRRRRTAGQEYEMPAYERRYSDWKR